MNYSTKSDRLDNCLLALIVFAFVALLSLSIVGHPFNRAAPSVDTGCGTESLPSRIASLLKTKSRFLAVVGDGVPGESLVVERPYNTQFAQGYDLYQGVHHALQAPSLQGILRNIGVLNIDDGGNPSCARKIAKILETQPALLGVIGHSTTSCTKEALPFYASSNIPIIIPAATNPALLASYCNNCFRLPSNDSIQSLVIADMIMSKFQAKTVFIVWDATPEAYQYSEYLKTTIQHYLSTTELLNKSPGHSPIIEGSYPISLNPLNYTYLFRRIVSSDAGVVVFAGYGSLAREFLLGLDYEYSHYPGRNRPKIILTDGCKIPGINGYNFDTYLTFSAAPLDHFPTFNGFDRGERIGPFEKMYLEESFEVFGYDAAVMFLTAIKVIVDREQGVSRKQVARFIATENQLIPTSYPYTFAGGDNTRHRYYCYSLARNSIAFEYDEGAVNTLLRKMPAHE